MDSVSFEVRHMVFELVGMDALHTSVKVCSRTLHTLVWRHTYFRMRTLLYLPDAQVRGAHLGELSTLMDRVRKAHRDCMLLEHLSLATRLRLHCASSLEDVPDDFSMMSRQSKQHVFASFDGIPRGENSYGAIRRQLADNIDHRVVRMVEHPCDDAATALKMKLCPAYEHLSLGPRNGLHEYEDADMRHALEACLEKYGADALHQGLCWLVDRLGVPTLAAWDLLLDFCNEHNVPVPRPACKWTLGRLQSGHRAPWQRDTAAFGMGVRVRGYRAFPIPLVTDPKELRSLAKALQAVKYGLRFFLSDTLRWICRMIDALPQYVADLYDEYEVRWRLITLIEQTEHVSAKHSVYDDLETRSRASCQLDVRLLAIGSPTPPDVAYRLADLAIDWGHTEQNMHLLLASMDMPHRGAAAYKHLLEVADKYKDLEHDVDHIYVLMQDITARTKRS